MGPPHLSTPEITLGAFGIYKEIRCQTIGVFKIEVEISSGQLQYYAQKHLAECRLIKFEEVYFSYFWSVTRANTRA